MNEVIKTLILLFTGGFIVVVAFLLAIIHNYRRTADETRKLDKDISDGKRDIADTTTAINQTAENIGRELSEAERIIQEVRNQPIVDDRNY